MMNEVFETDGRKIDAYTAAALGDLEIIKDVVSCHNVNLKNIDSWTLLMYACYYDRQEIVKYLVTLGADKSLRCKKGRTALMIAALSGNIEIIPLVFEKKILEFKEGRGMTALGLTVQHGHQIAAEILLSVGAEPDVLLGNRTPLMLASKQGHFSLVKVLLHYGANPLLVDTRGKTAIDMAIENERPDIVRLMTTHVLAGMGKVQSILTNLGLENYSKKFEENNVTYQQLLNMSEEEMKLIGMKKFGPRRKLSIFIKQLREVNGGGF